MGLSLHTALAIQNNKVRCEAGGPSKDTGKFCGWVMMDVDRWHPLLQTKVVYPTAADAEKAMEELVETVRKADLKVEIKKLSAILDGKPVDDGDPMGNAADIGG